MPLTRILGKRYIGVNLFEFPIIAVDLKEGLFLNISRSEIRESLSKSKKFNEKKGLDKLNTNTYWYDFEIVTEMFRHILHETNCLFIKPEVCISMPYAALEADSGDIFKRMVEEAAMCAGFQKIYLIEDFMCAACGMGFVEYKAETYGKNIFIFSAGKYIYIGLIFAGSAFNVRMVEKSYNNLTAEDIKNEFNEFKNSVSNEIPEKFENISLSASEKEIVKKSWAQKMQKKIYLSVDLGKEDIFLKALQDDNEEYELIFDKKHDLAIINGMKKVLYLLKAKKT